MPGISGVFSKTIIETHLNSPENTNFNIYYGAVDNWSYSSTYDLAASSMGKHVPMFILMERKYRCLLFDIHITNFFLSLDIKKYVCHHLTNN